MDSAVHFSVPLHHPIQSKANKVPISTLSIYAILKLSIVSDANVVVANMLVAA